MATKNSAGFKLEKRTCPACGKEFDCPRTAPQERACSMDCGYALRALSRPSKPKPERNLPTGEEARAIVENRQLKKQLRDAITTHVSNEAYADFVARVDTYPLATPPKWLTKTGTKADRVCIPTSFLSDTHFDENINPLEVAGVNAYSREIAEDRLKRFFVNSIRLAKAYFSGLSYPGIVLPMGGDMFSGNIHEELKETNADTLCGSMVHWIPQLLAGIRLFADEFGAVFIPCVVGNHTRGTRKPIAKHRVRDNFDWLLYQLLRRETAGDKRITWMIPDTADCTYRVLQTTYCLSHGDQFRGGSGISGMLSPLMLGDHRKRKRAAAIRMPYDYLLIGHWHQLGWMRGILVNGSLKGYDEYAMVSNFDFEPAQQAFFLNSSERRGLWGFTPINVTAHDDPYSGSQMSEREITAAFERPRKAA